jgi:beta-glucosidase/6-phospho-beta-glucosidase/beta-galactosidase
LDFYRFSIAWTRILPNGELSSKNQKGIEYYHKLIDALLENDIVPFITMYHWDLPQPLQDQGGWENRMIVDKFKIYAEILFDEYGSKVKNWITFNEPSVYCIEGYGIGTMAPLLSDPGVGEYKCVHHTLLAHADAYHMYKEKFGDQGQIGITLNTGFVFSADGRDADFVRDKSMQFSLGWYMHPLMKGNYPQVMIDEIARFSAEENRVQSRLPAFTAAEIERIKGSTDFMGLNYYSSYLASVAENPSDHKDNGLTGGVHACWKRAKSTWLYSVPQGIRGLLK